MNITIDFETRSACDLKKCGAWVYSEHPTTDVLCLAVKVDDKAPRRWVPKWTHKTFATPAPFYNTLSDKELFSLFAQAETIEAHNMFFERSIWQNVCIPKYGWPEIPVGKLRCSLAKVSMHNLPRGLEQAAKALGLPIRKDMDGYRIMMKMCKPRKPRKGEDPDDLFWNEDPIDFVTLCRYCAQDVETEHALSKVLSDLPAKELKIWQLDQEINVRGIQADVPSARNMVAEIKKYEATMLEEFRRLTRGQVASPKQWDKLLALLAEEGLTLDDATKNTVAKALKDDGTPPLARDILEIRKTLAKASTAKYDAIIRTSGRDGRIRGTLLYHGCGTGRWSGKGIQPQNFPRGNFSDTEDCISLMNDGGFDLVSALWGDPMNAASTCLRGMLMAAPGKDLVAADFSGIESRGLAWTAGEQDIIDNFNRGLDNYIIAANKIFGSDYSTVYAAVDSGEKWAKEQRQTGKCSELGLGYNGGIGAYVNMATVYRVNLEALPPFVFPLADAETMRASQKWAAEWLKRNESEMSLDAATACDIIKRIWRASRPRVVALWKGLEECAYKAVQEPGKVFQYRSAAYKVERGFLLCRLPSGRCLFYYQPRIKEAETPWGATKQVVTFMGLGGPSGNTWMRLPLHGGILTNNVVQGTCRDLMAEAMLRLEAAGYPVVLTVHDEVVAEVPEGFGSVEEFERIMSEVPAWAAGCPVGAEGFRTRRYRK